MRVCPFFSKYERKVSRISEGESARLKPDAPTKEYGVHGSS